MDFRSEAEEEEQSLRASGSQRGLDPSPQLGPTRREAQGFRICTSNPGPQEEKTQWIPFVTQSNGPEAICHLLY